MATIIGTAGNDTLIGTSGDDTLVANGGVDLLLGKGGSDLYELLFSAAEVVIPEYRINETNGGDASTDTITGTGALVQYSYVHGYDFTTFERIGKGGKTLVINVPMEAGTEETGKITIVNQYKASKPNAKIEILEADGVFYNLRTTNNGTSGNDIMTGWEKADTFHARAGDDYVSGGKGRDTLYGDKGDDVLFGGSGRDSLYGGEGADHILAGAGDDKAYGGDGDDILKGNAGEDILRGNAGDDILDGGKHNDRLFGGKGKDTLIGGDGDDRMIGGKDGDTYVISSLGAGHDTIVDKGNAANQQYPWLTINLDGIEFTDFTSLDDAVHNIDLQISGDDLVITYNNIEMSGVEGQVTVQNHFLSGKYALELIDFGTGGEDATYHISFLSGDNYIYSVQGGNDAGGNDIVLGTTGDDEIYGGLGSDIMLGGGGADHFMFHDEEDNRGGTDLILDFDVTDDTLDFTDIAGFDFSGVALSESAHGNALISSIYGNIELDGVNVADVSAGIFAFG